MENVQKYFTIIEDLDRNISPKNDIEHIKSNIDVIRKYIKLDAKSLLDTPSLRSIHYVSEELLSEDLAWNYATLLFHILLTINNQINLNSANKEELISLQQQDVYAFYVMEATRYGICPNIVKEMKTHQIFKLDLPQKGVNSNRITICLRFLSEIYKIDFLMAGSKIDHAKLQSMAGAVSILSFDSKQNSYIHNFLMCLYGRSCKVIYFRNLLILKSIQNLPVDIQKILHEELLAKLQSPMGFKVLLEAVVPMANPETPNWKCFEVISNIVSQKGHSEYFFENLINQVFQFLTIASGSEQQSGYIPGGVLSLRKLYQLKSSTKVKILNNIDELFKKLYDPEDVLTGTIILEDNEFLNLLKLLNLLFCGSSLQSLQSEILIKYLPILIQCYGQIPNNFKQNKLIKSLAIQCLANRRKEEMKSLLKILLLEEFDEKYRVLHPRLSLNFKEKSDFVNIQICSPEMINRPDFFITLCQILKSSNNNILIYNAFISVLYLFEDESYMSTTGNSSCGLLRNQEELSVVVEKKFKSKFAVISFLTDMIEFKPLHSQFKENPDDILDFLKSSLYKALDGFYSSEEKLSITLAILQEIIENSESVTKFQSFVIITKKLVAQEKSTALKYQLDHILNILEGTASNESRTSRSFEKSEYGIARSLIEENQPYLKVYGITLMIKLIRQKDLETINNRHTILAIALHALKDEESYTFLNCVKLFVILNNILDTEVLNVLSDEYLSDNNDCDYRLKIGEAILKVTEDLGPISYNYKNVLINCFLSGCRHQLDEFRVSSISNLATVCKLLTYQIHNFFQELLQLIESILQTDKYLPAKRATVLVLFQLLSGMDNLLNFQDYLLPIYRVLKHIAANDPDPVMRVHSNNGLKVLSDKCKTMLSVEQNFQKEIKIFGVKDKQEKKKNDYIVKLN